MKIDGSLIFVVVSCLLEGCEFLSLLTLRTTEFQIAIDDLIELASIKHLRLITISICMTSALVLICFKILFLLRLTYSLHHSLQLIDIITDCL